MSETGSRGGAIVMSLESLGASPASSQALQLPDEESLKSCWVCFATEADDKLAAWVQPCKCIGTTKWASSLCFFSHESQGVRRFMTEDVASPNASFTN